MLILSTACRPSSRHVCLSSGVRYAEKITTGRREVVAQQHLRRVDAGDARQRVVEHEHVGLVLLEQLVQPGHVARLQDAPALGAEARLQDGAKVRLVVDDDHGRQGVVRLVEHSSLCVEFKTPAPIPRKGDAATAAKPGHAALGADRRTRRAGSSTATAAACTTRMAESAAAGRPAAGSPAGSSSRAGTARRCCSRASSPSSSSSTRRPRSPPATGPARSAAARTTTASSRSRARPAPTRSTCGLHEERTGPRRRASNLPDGAFVLHDSRPHLVLGDALLEWEPGGYREPIPRPPGPAEVITPPTLVGVLRAGWQGAVPLLHPSARA